MKFTSYLYIDSSGDIVEFTKKPSYRQRTSKTVCLKVDADIPDEYFETPTFGVEVVVPRPKLKPHGGSVQEWLAKEVEELEELDEDEDEEEDCKPDYDVPF